MIFPMTFLAIAKFQNLLRVCGKHLLSKASHALHFFKSSFITSMQVLQNPWQPILNKGNGYCHSKWRQLYSMPFICLSQNAIHQIWWHRLTVLKPLFRWAGWEHLVLLLQSSCGKYDISPVFRSLLSYCTSVHIISGMYNCTCMH